MHFDPHSSSWERECWLPRRECQLHSAVLSCVFSTLAGLRADRNSKRHFAPAPRECPPGAVTAPHRRLRGASAQGGRAAPCGYPDAGHAPQDGVGEGSQMSHGAKASGRAAKYLNRNSCMVFPGSAGVSPAPEAARMAALPGETPQDHHDLKIVSRYLGKRGRGQSVWQCSWRVIVLRHTVLPPRRSCHT